jgi:branched-chain amino acid transport system permease protein
MSGIPYRVERSTRTGWFGVAVLVLLVGGLLSVPARAGRAEMRLLVEVCYYLALAEAWNLLAGYAGLVSVGQQAYVGLGCYGFLILTAFLGLNPLIALPLTGMLVATAALPISLIAFRLRGAHFAIGTWVLAEVLRLIFTLIKPFGAGTGMSLPISVVREIAEGRAARELIIYYTSLTLDLLHQPNACDWHGAPGVFLVAFASGPRIDCNPRLRSGGGEHRHQSAAHEACCLLNCGAHRRIGRGARDP